MGSKTGFLTISEALRQGSKLLDDAGISASRLTAEVLLAHALKKDRVYLFGHSTDELTEVAWIHYGRYLNQRIDGKPTQYITKWQEFYGRDFAVCPDVLIPRPETEHVVSAALERISVGARVVDVGCGSGAIAVSVALEANVEMFAVDISEAALKVASLNAKRLDARVRFLAGDLLEAFAPETLDAVLSNPPYIGLDEADGLEVEVRDHEPSVALFGGPTGTDLYARLIERVQVVLRAGGWLVLELGWRSLDPVQAMLTDGWTDIEPICDLSGIPRVLTAKWAP